LRRTATATAFLLSFLVSVDVAVAQSSVSAPPADRRATDSAYRKGAIDWRVIAGGALPVNWTDARADRRLWLVATEIGWTVTKPHGPGGLAGQLEILMQAMPIVVRGPQDFWGVGLSPLFLRWNFSAAKQVRPFAEASAGVMLIDWETPGPGRVVGNFNEQIGFGLRVGRPSGTGLVGGFRYQHISNGGRAHPSSGVDTYLVYAGVSFVR